MTKPHAAEIVTFKLKQGVERGDFLTAANGINAYIHSTGGLISRTLSCDADGLWTDYIVWRTMDIARTVAAEAMTRPEFAPFGALIDDTSVEMRHAEVVLQMD